MLIINRSETRVLPLGGVGHSCPINGRCPSKLKGRVVLRSHLEQAYNRRF